MTFFRKPKVLESLNGGELLSVIREKALEPRKNAWIAKTEEFSQTAFFTERVSLKSLRPLFSLSSLRSFVANQLPDLG